MTKIEFMLTNRDKVQCTLTQQNDLKSYIEEIISAGVNDATFLNINNGKDYIRVNHIVRVREVK